MRFGLAHKTATYLMVVAAFIAMVGGGGVSPLIALLGLVGLVTSWWWEPPLIRYDKWALAWTLASLLVLAYAVLSAIATGDYLGVGGEFLIWLTVAKACNRRAARDWQQLYLLAFLMLVAGSVLNTELNYGVAFLVFVLASTWALTLFHLRREMEDNFLLKHADDRASERVEVRRILASRRIVDGRFFAGTGVVSVIVFVASAAFFIAIPRIGMGFFFKSRGGLSMAGFADGVQLGGHGRIKLDSTVVMRVELPERFGGRNAPPVHWRGAAFDHYEAGRWSRTRNSPYTDVAVMDRGATVALILRGLVPEPGAMVKQDVWLEPFDTDVLFTGAQPVVVEVPRKRVERTRPPPQANDELRIGHSDTMRYTVYSQIEPPPADVLRRARGGEPLRGLDAYTQLPCRGDPSCPPGVAITPRTIALARQITAGRDNNYDRATAIVDWLQQNLDYTLDLAEIPDGQEAVDFFLFDRKKGHCEYFASAFAVLARSVGIPTRNVNGFLGGEWNEYADYVAVRAGDAHSWNEVWFPGHGWVTFDPTPPGQIDQLGRGGDGILARLRRFLDRLRFQWSKWVIEYDLYRQLGLFRDIGRAFQGAGRAIKNAAIAVKDAALRYWYVVMPVLGLLGFAIGRRIARRRRDGPRGMSGERRRRKRPVAEIWGEVVARLARHGLARDPALTPRELARRWEAPGSTELAELVELYYAVEYGGADETEALPKARTLRDTIQAGLKESARAATR